MPTQDVPGLSRPQWSALLSLAVLTVTLAFWLVNHPSTGPGLRLNSAWLDVDLPAATPATPAQIAALQARLRELGVDCSQVETLQTQSVPAVLHTLRARIHDLGYEIQEVRDAPDFTAFSASGPLPLLVVATREAAELCLVSRPLGG